MFPEVDETLFEIDETSEEAAYEGKSFLFDFEKGEFVLRDGKLVPVTGVEALKIWIVKTLKTEKFRYKIYEKEDTDDEYGVLIEDLVVGNNFSQDFIESELKREITDALLKHPKIESISDFSTEREKTLLKISFTVDLVTEDSFNQEVSF
jgi:hypothetical protein